MHWWRSFRVWLALLALALPAALWAGGVQNGAAVSVSASPAAPAAAAPVSVRAQRYWVVCVVSVCRGTRVGHNWYAYAGGDPVNRWDPSGLWDINYTQGTATMEPGDTWETLYSDLGLIYTMQMRMPAFLTDLENLNPGVSEVAVGDTVQLDQAWVAEGLQQNTATRDLFVQEMKKIAAFNGQAFLEGDVTSGRMNAMYLAGIESYARGQSRLRPEVAEELAANNYAALWRRLEVRLGNQTNFLTPRYAQEIAEAHQRAAERREWAEPVTARLTGALRIGGGAYVGAKGVGLSATGIGALPGVPMAAWGGDQMGTGLVELWTGEFQSSLGGGFLRRHVGWGTDVVYDIGPVFSPASVASSAGRPGLLTRARRFFYDNRNFQRQISPEYWAAKGGANGRSLHHWLIPQRARWAPQGIRNAGWNTLDMPALRSVFHRSLGLNQWMGFARNWGARHARRAALVENSIRVGIPLAVGATAWGAYELGSEISERLWGEQ